MAGETAGGGIGVPWVEGSRADAVRCYSICSSADGTICMVGSAGEALPVAG